MRPWKELKQIIDNIHYTDSLAENKQLPKQGVYSIMKMKFPDISRYLKIIPGSRNLQKYDSEFLEIHKDVLINTFFGIILVQTIMTFKDNIPPTFWVKARDEILIEFFK